MRGLGPLRFFMSTFGNWCSVESSEKHKRKDTLFMSRKYKVPRIEYRLILWILKACLYRWSICTSCNHYWGLGYNFDSSVSNSSLEIFEQTFNTETISKGQRLKVPISSFNRNYRSCSLWASLSNVTLHTKPLKSSSLFLIHFHSNFF